MTGKKLVRQSARTTAQKLGRGEPASTDPLDGALDGGDVDDSVERQDTVVPQPVITASQAATVVTAPLRTEERVEAPQPREVSAVAAAAPVTATPAAQRRVTPPAHRASDGATVGGKYPTGVDVPRDIHSRFVATAESTKQGSAQVRRTELLLRAFEAAYPTLDAIIEEAGEVTQLDSQLFGTRTVETTTGPQETVRLQVRPTYAQYETLMDLAAAKGMPLARLVRIVLDWYLPKPKPRKKTDEAATA
jgi:hypothetical protein